MYALIDISNPMVGESGNEGRVWWALPRRCCCGPTPVYRIVAPLLERDVGVFDQPGILRELLAGGIAESPAPRCRGL